RKWVSAEDKEIPPFSRNDCTMARIRGEEVAAKPPTSSPHLRRLPVIPSGARKLKKIEKRTIKERFLLSVGMTAQWRGLEGKRWTAKPPTSSPHLRSLPVIPSGARKLKKIEKWTIKGEIPPFSRNNGTMARIRGEEVAAKPP